jgi:hypothetical protein
MPPQDGLGAAVVASGEHFERVTLLAGQVIARRGLAGCHRLPRCRFRLSTGGCQIVAAQNEKGRPEGRPRHAVALLPKPKR